LALTDFDTCLYAEGVRAGGKVAMPKLNYRDPVDGTFKEIPYVPVDMAGKSSYAHNQGSNTSITWLAQAMSADTVLPVRSNSLNPQTLGATVIDEALVVPRKGTYMVRFNVLAHSTTPNVLRQVHLQYRDLGGQTWTNWSTVSKVTAFAPGPWKAGADAGGTTFLNGSFVDGTAQASRSYRVVASMGASAAGSGYARVELLQVVLLGPN
jgi:hypothetical protein